MFGLQYLPTLGEKWPHSKGHVVNIPYMEHLGLCLFNDARLLGCKLQWDRILSLSLSLFLYLYVSMI